MTRTTSFIFSPEKRSLRKKQLINLFSTLTKENCLPRYLKLISFGNCTKFSELDRKPAKSFYSARNVQVGVTLFAKKFKKVADQIFVACENE